MAPRPKQHSISSSGHGMTPGLRKPWRGQSSIESTPFWKFGRDDESEISKLATTSFAYGAERSRAGLKMGACCMTTNRSIERPIVAPSCCYYCCCSSRCGGICTKARECIQEGSIGRRVVRWLLVRCIPGVGRSIVRRDLFEEFHQGRPRVRSEKQVQPEGA